MQWKAMFPYFGLMTYLIIHEGVKYFQRHTWGTCIIKFRWRNLIFIRLLLRTDYYEFLVMCLTNIFFKKYIGKFVLIFMHDILVYSKTSRAHIKRNICARCFKSQKIIIIMSKCEFLTFQVEYLNHIVSKEGSIGWS